MIKEAFDMVKEILPKNVEVELGSKERTVYLLNTAPKDKIKLPLIVLDLDEVKPYSVKIKAHLFSEYMETFMTILEDIIPYVVSDMEFYSENGGTGVLCERIKKMKNITPKDSAKQCFTGEIDFSVRVPTKAKE